MKKKWMVLGVVWLFIGYNAFGQSTFKESVLDEEPYFALHNGHLNDSLFLRDLRILRHFGTFDGVDSSLLKAPVLANMMIEQVRAGKPATYRTLVEYIIDFKKTEAYRQFTEGLQLLKRLQDKKVNPANWEEDKVLFVRMGFTESDLDDFKNYISEPAKSEFTYKQAYAAYMKEIEALSPKPKRSK
ncbi:hypothetical protein [Pedobacter sp.]|uniref:hypothetical protein n=1 Tax=Pedobacter sp. TaxID=1411316 RepID=UPI002D803CAE|nr:hypothetical protein [Pedobacter sp.]